jgi:murein DD-endopeptidase MepM/ murein hydrolase activator NlpD
MEDLKTTKFTKFKQSVFKKNFVLLCFTLWFSLLLSACLTPTGTQKPAQIVNYGQGGAGTTGIHTVRGGETIYKISQRYRLPLREIISINSLSAPYTLNAGYRLKLPPPNDYTVREGDTLNGISRLFNVSVSEMARVNELSAPYVLKKGQVIRLPARQPKLEENLMQASRIPSFDEPTSTGPLKVESVEAEALPPPPSQTQAQVSVSSFPPQPTAKPAVATPAEPAKAEQASAATSLPRDIAPKVPARAMGRFMRPVDGKIISGYGPKEGGLHNDGINIKAARGTPVRAAENGVVVYVGDEMAGYGNLVLIRHADRWMTAYAHMDKTLVRKNDIVKAGQSIGTVGSTGQVDTPQLHFEIRRGTKALDPQKYL